MVCVSAKVEREGGIDKLPLMRVSFRCIKPGRQRGFMPVKVNALMRRLELRVSSYQSGKRGHHYLVRRNETVGDPAEMSSLWLDM